jgi:phosphoribosylformimino-5-aminoimidazole carboxamide ribotide isomerase
MKIYPALDILDGKCVRLRRGDFENKTIYFEDLEKVVESIEKSGVKYLHLVDLSGARNPEKRQFELIRQIISSSHLKIQCGGGVRSIQEVYDLLKLGADRVILGSIALYDSELTLLILKEFGPNKITLAIDLEIEIDGSIKIAVDGWQKTSEKKISEWMNGYLKAGLKRILCTDIRRDGMMRGPNTALYQDLIEQYPNIELQASGGISQLLDLQAVKQVGVHSAIIGKAFYEGKILLKEAIAQC